MRTIWGTAMGVIHWDTRSLDYGSHPLDFLPVNYHIISTSIGFSWRLGFRVFFSL